MEISRADTTGKKQEIETVRNAIPRGDGGMAQVIVSLALRA